MGSWGSLGTGELGKSWHWGALALGEPWYWGDGGALALGNLGIRDLGESGHWGSWVFLSNGGKWGSLGTGELGEPDQCNWGDGGAKQVVFCTVFDWF